MAVNITHNRIRISGNFGHWRAKDHHQWLQIISIGSDTFICSEGEEWLVGNPRISRRKHWAALRGAPGQHCFLPAGTSRGPWPAEPAAGDPRGIRLGEAARLSRLLVSDLVRLCRRQPPGSAAPGLLQARTLEWAATSFSSRGETTSVVCGSQESTAKARYKSLSCKAVARTPIGKWRPDCSCSAGTKSKGHRGSLRGRLRSLELCENLSSPDSDPGPERRRLTAGCRLTPARSAGGAAGLVPAERGPRLLPRRGVQRPSCACSPPGRSSPSARARPASWGFLPSLPSESACPPDGLPAPPRLTGGLRLVLHGDALLHPGLSGRTFVFLPLSPPRVFPNRGN